MTYNKTYYKAGVTLSEWRELYVRLQAYKIILSWIDRFCIPIVLGVLAIAIGIINQEWVGVLITVLLLLTWIPLQLSFIKKHKVLYTEKEIFVNFLEKGIEIKNLRFEGVMNWDCFPKAFEDENFVMIFEKDKTMPLVIQKNKVSEDDMITIRKFVRNFQKK